MDHKNIIIKRVLYMASESVRGIKTKMIGQDSNKRVQQTMTFAYWQKQQKLVVYLIGTARAIFTHRLGT